MRMDMETQEVSETMWTSTTTSYNRVDETLQFIHGFTFDSELSMKMHVIKICQTAYFELKCISSVCRFLTEDATKTLVTSYILS